MTDEMRNLYLMIDPSVPPAEAFIPQVDPATTLVTAWSAVSALDDLIDTTVPALSEAIAGKADKVAGGVSGNFASLDADGNLDDSGYADSDLLRKADATAKGDLFAAEGVGSVSILNVGTDGQVLTADSGETSGLIWATPVAGVTDHGELDGLGDDDHSIYYNQARGDARYHRMENWRGPLRQFTDFLTFVASPDYTNIPWAGYTINGAGTCALSSAVDANHPGVVLLGAGSTANTGFRYYSHGSMTLVGASEKFVCIFKTYNAPNGTVVWRAGYQDSGTHADPTDGAWLQFVQAAGTIDGRRNNAGAGVSTTATAFTYADATWYRGEVEVNAAASVITFSIYLCSSGALVWSDTLATVPTGVTGHGIGAWNTQAASVGQRDLVHVDYLAIIINRTLVR
jgi:hypothetical protein